VFIGRRLLPAFFIKLHPVMPITSTGLQKILNPEFVLHSRIHLLNQTFANGAKVYIKREDELSSGIAGSKCRKFASLIPYIVAEAFDEIVVIGGAQSNNVVAALQLLNENGIPARLILLERNENELKGNMLWISLLHNVDDIIWVKRNEWENVATIALEYQKRESGFGKKVFILHEGSAVVQAIPGAMGLALDIYENEKAIDKPFEHVFIDSGSGVSAIGLLKGFQYIGRFPQIHITLIAGTPVDFMEQYHKLCNSLNESNTYTFDDQVLQYLHFYEPVSARSFGSVNKNILTNLKNIARNEGILMDPVYSVKHFITAVETIDKQQLTGNILFIYNGGSFALSGFMDKLVFE
jgi:1-aminocyclopropane-1-carboxylate deaminase